MHPIWKKKSNDPIQLSKALRYKVNVVQLGMYSVFLI